MASDQGTEFSFGHIQGTSRRYLDAAELEAKHYDVLIVAASWDARSVFVTGLNVTADVAIMIVPGLPVDEPDRHAHEVELNTWLSTVAGRVDRVVYEDDLLHAYVEVVALLTAPDRRGGSMLFDMSACARFLSLGIYWRIQAQGLADVVEVLYAEGDHASAIEAGAYGESEFDGWVPVSIPGLEGDWFPTRPSSVLISAGFEASRVSQILELNDVARIGILIGSPGVVDEFEVQARARNKAWMNAVGDYEELKQPAGDAIAVWQALVHWGAHENVRALLGGPKAHSLGIALASITTGRFGLVYLKPLDRRKRAIESLGPFWIYTLKDLSAIASLQVE